MEHASLTPVAPADAASITELVLAVESKLYGQTAFSQADLEDEWLELDLQDVHVVRDGEHIVGYAVAIREEGELWRVEGYVHPDAVGRGIGKLIATGIEQHAAGRGAGRVQNHVLEADSAGRELLESLGYTAVRVFREMRIDLEKSRASRAGSNGTTRRPSGHAGAGGGAASSMRSSRNTRTAP